MASQLRFEINLHTEANIRAVNAAIPVALRAGLAAIKAATDPLTPRDTGALIESGSFVVEGNKGNISYGVPYAARQHEDMTYSHPHGGGPKFLERGVRAASGKVFAQLRRELLE